MTADLDLDRRLAAYFAAEAPERAPDRVLAVAMDRVDVTRQRSRRAIAMPRWERLSRAQRLVLVAASLLLLGAAVAIGAWLLQQDSGGGQSMVFVTPGVGTPEDGGLTVHLREPDGTTRVLASYSSDELSGRYADGAGIAVSPDGYLAVPISLEGYSSEYRIVDLRDPDAPIRAPDAESRQGAWGPGGLFAMFVNQGGYVVYDVTTGRSRYVPGSDVGFRMNGFEPIWADDGSGLQADRQAGNGVAEQGVIDFDGQWVAGSTAAYEAGVGARRTFPDGSRLRCTDVEDGGCEIATELTAFGPDGRRRVYVVGSGRRVADFATSADGTGIWVLDEPTGKGPRDTRLLRVGPDGTERVVASFDGVPDDADEFSYFPSGSFAAMSDDDATIVIRMAGDQGSLGSMWLVDTATGVATPIPGTPAGWLAPNGLTAPRPAAELIVELDDALRGSWAMRGGDGTGVTPEGWRLLTFGRSTANLDIGSGRPVSFATEAVGGDAIRFEQLTAGGGCPPGSTAVYGWRIDRDSLTLEPREEDCEGRSTLLARSFERSLPVPDTGSVALTPGTDYLAAMLPVPIRVQVPDPSAMMVDTQSDTAVGLSAGPEGPYVSVYAIDGVPTEVCDHRSDGTDLAPGTEAALEHLRSLEDRGLLVTATEPIEIDGHLAVRVSAAIPSGQAGCGRRGLSVFKAGEQSVSVTPTSRLTLVEPAPGQVVAIIDSTGGGSDADRAAADAIISSLRFVTD
jgi:hypothetical protein